MKFENIDLVDALRRIMDIHTQNYKEDFELDAGLLHSLAGSQSPEDKHLLWMSRPNGTYLLPEREVYVEDSYENKVWEFYHEQTRDPILAYAVEIKGVEGDTVKGNLIELDYAAHVERMQKLTVPVETVAVTFKNDATFYLPFRSYRREAIPLEEKHGEVVSVSYLPENAVELDMILRRERFKTSYHAKTGSIEDHIHKLAVQHGVIEKLGILPLEAQTAYNAVKEAHPEAIVCFAQNSYFEIYGEDAKKAAALLARVDFVRELLPAGLPDRWEAGDDAFLVQFAKYWLYRRDRRKVERLLGRIPEERRTYEVREHLVLSLLLDHDPARAREMIATLKPETDEEKSSREWLLGLAAQRRGDADAAIEHFRKSRDLSPESTSANFPLAQSLLAKYGPENEEYKAARNFLKTRAPTGWQLLLTEEARRRKAQNFERELLPELSSGVFSATILLPQGSLELRKERLADELWRSWSLGLADKTPDDRDAFSFRIGWLEGSARLVRERITDTSLAEAVQRNPFARDAESLLLCHAGRIELRVSAGSTAPKDAAIVYAQVLAALLRVSEPLGVLTLGNIHPAELLIDHSEFIRRGDFPVLSVIYLGMAEDLGEHYISSYGLRSLGLPEIEIDTDGFDPSAAGMLAFSIVERMIAGELTDEAAMLRFGPDPEHLTQLAITKRPGRRVATEVLRLTQGEAPEETPQA